MKIHTISNRAHHYQDVNDKVSEFIAREDVTDVELKPFVTDSKYMVVILYKEKKPAAKKVAKKKAPAKEKAIEVI